MLGMVYVTLDHARKYNCASFLFLLIRQSSFGAQTTKHYIALLKYLKPAWFYYLITVFLTFVFNLL